LEYVSNPTASAKFENF